MSTSRRVWLTGIAVAILAAGLSVFLYEPKERLYQGKRAGEWLAELNRPMNDAQIEQWKAMGADGVPILIDALRNGTGILPRIYATLYPRLPDLVQRRLHPPVDVSQARANAAAILTRMGPEASDAAPLLAKAMNDRNVRIRVAAALAMTAVYPGADKSKARMFPHFLQAMKDTNIIVREHAAMFLADYREQSRTVTPMLVKALGDTAMPVRMRAFTGLNQMDFSKVNSKEVAPMLIESSKSKDPVVRVTAASKLGVMAKQPRQAVPALVDLLNDPEPVVRHAAAVALGRFGAEAKPAVPALVKTLEAPEPVVRLAATNALAQIEPSKWNPPVSLAH